MLHPNRFTFTIDTNKTETPCHFAIVPKRGKYSKSHEFCNKSHEICNTLIWCYMCMVDRI